MKNCTTATRRAKAAKGRTPKRPPLKLSFEYMDSPERRVLSLEPDGIPCLPVIGFDRYRKQWRQAPPHVHEECIEVSLCLNGNLEFEADGRVWPFKPGSIFVSGPKDVHRLRTYPKGMSKYWFLFRIPGRGFPLLGLPPDEARALKRSLVTLPNRLFEDTGEVRAAFKTLFRQFDALAKRGPERTLRLRSTVLSLLLAVVDAASAPRRERSEVRLARIAAAMREKPEEDYPLDALAETAGLSASNLLVRFKRLTGSPPHAYLLAQRIAKAKTLLASGGRVGEIARALGFHSSQHFSNHFRSATGLTPSAFAAR